MLRATTPSRLRRSQLRNGRRGQPRLDCPRVEAYELPKFHERDAPLGNEATDAPLSDSEPLGKAGYVEQRRCRWRICANHSNQ